MGRGGKRAKAKVGGERPAARKSPENDDSGVRAVLERQLAEARAQLQTRDHDLAEALERQTATAEILRVISSSPADTQPVFVAIARRVVRLCDGYFSTVWRYDGTLIHHAADNYPTREMRDILTRGYPAPVQPESVVAQAIGESRVVHVEDLFDGSAPAASREVAMALGYRTLLCVPMLRDGVSIGAIAVARREQRPFTDRQIELVKTFADQAVIAIENVRLFNELQGRNRDLTEALEQQTATSEILRVISSSPSAVQPVFDAIVQSAVRLCGARYGALYRRYDEVVDCVAHVDVTPETKDLLRRAFPRPVSVGTTPQFRRALLHGAVASIPDIEVDPELTPPVLAVYRRHKTRSVVMVPLLHQAEVVGVLVVGHDAIAAFTDSHVELLKTFAAQAVIAIENVRLFTELQATNRALMQAHGQVSEALERQTATAEILRVISQSPTDIQPVFDAIARNAVSLCGGIRALVLRFDGVMLHVAGHHNIDPHGVEQITRAYPQRPGRDTPAGRAFLHRCVVHVPDLQAASGEFADSTARGRGVRSLLAVPLLREREAVGVIGVAREVVGAFSPEQIEVLQTFADQAVIAIENVRLFNDLERANRDLSVASRHKSEFLANMSHELRTPLNAIIGFSEVLAERMFGEINDKQAEYLNDILESARHLLSLINDILDLSKVEAGRMELAPSDFDLVTAIESTLVLIRERAHRHGITVERSIGNGVGTIRADERKVRQVLLNLLSNAIKFTPDGGRIDVRARVHDDVAELSVADTGVGIAPEHQAAVFEEFRQVGTTSKKVEGTGLGLAISRKFVELHGGRIWVTSAPGVGSTFAFTLPLAPRG